MNNRRLTILAFVAGAVTVGLLMTGPPTAMAQMDPQLFICQSCSSPPGSDPNLITNTGNFTVGVAGADTMQSPLLIVIANYDSSAQPTVSFGTSEPLATVGTYGLTANNVSSFTSGDVFSALGLAAGGSLSFGNLSTGDTKNSIAAPSFFSLWAFAVPTNLAGAVSGFAVSGAANGSYIEAYSCINGKGSSSGCAKNGDIGQSVNTNQGLVDAPHAPEASAVTLTSLVLLAFGALMFRSRRNGLA